MSTSRPAPIVGDLSLTTEDGATLSARTDVGLAEAWVRHTLGRQWDQLTYGEQTRQVSEALAELRRAHSQSAS
ncbi:hypothetical protein ATK17_3903 [Branchiibius hedensis]|uniref:Uncharacterized protein n=1 Tax=Branchiibius hedensis TaxID=672460 RepID=A0A2Y9BMV6_9MICO|nr:hypothetical protein [Branchiibius hedensis]PWJ23012.1 hypothetical protein ATK17_3903 [Branchiibius hedensis]SSA59088.1 hypothetical protein SAMN04489750_3903 [Branchiibius hedensis]